MNTIISRLFYFYLIFLLITPIFSVNADGGTSTNTGNESNYFTQNTELISISDSLKKIALKKDTASWVGTTIALLLGLAGIFSLQDVVRKRIIKPILGVEINLEPPDCHKIAMRNNLTGTFAYDSYYFRFRVKNTGNYQMEDVEVMVEELDKKNSNGRYVKVANFLPLNLVWAHNRVVTMPKIQPKLYKHCDFGHILQRSNVNLAVFGITQASNIVFFLDSFVAPNTGSHIILPGDYKIKVIFAANNVLPETFWYQLKISDKWDNNEKNMLANNISIKRIV